MLTSYHNHTTWSDGVETVEQMIAGAQKAGLDELGLSDHFALDPDERSSAWAMKSEFLPEYVAQIRQAGANAQGLEVRLGLEVDYYPETIQLVPSRLKPYPFDFLIGSVHFVDGFPVDLDSGSWKELAQNSRNDVWRGYWRYLRAVAETRLFDIIGHFDLPKKFGYFPTIDLTSEALETLDAIATAEAAMELNTSGWNKPVQESYPSLFYLQEANQRKIPLVINADAHKAEDLVGHFDRARALAVEAGYTELVGFHQRRRFTYPL